jgi:hypothetical protein
MFVYNKFTFTLQQQHNQLPDRILQINFDCLSFD